MLQRRQMRLNHASELHGGSLFRIFNSYLFNFNGGLRIRRTGYCLLRTSSPRGKQFLWFLNIDLLRFHRIYLLSDWSNFFFMCLLRINLLNLCPNNFDAVDFSECHSEEVISFFWRSVYIKNNKFIPHDCKHCKIVNLLSNSLGSPINSMSYGVTSTLFYHTLPFSYVIQRKWNRIVTCNYGMTDNRCRS